MINRAIGVFLMLATLGFSMAVGQDPARPVKVTIKEEQKIEKANEMSLPVDPVPRVEYQYVGNMAIGITVGGKLLCCGAGAIRTTFSIDRRQQDPNNAAAMPLPPGPRGKKRDGVQAVANQGPIQITQTLEIVPSRADPKAATKKRQRDTVLIKYIIENKDTREHSVGVRVRIDTYCVDNDGALFASPTTHPGKVLNGMLFKDKLPEYVQILQRPDLNNPGFVGHFTLKLGNKIEGPNRFALTSHGAGENGWDVQVIPSNGDSDAVVYFDPKPLKPGQKREIAYAYGQGIASNPENEGRVTLSLGGNFEPLKAFTLAAYVDDPLEGQTLVLELPEGMERLEGNETQAVPAPADNGASMILWKARVLRTGTFVLRVRSSNGVVHTRTITIERAALATPLSDKPRAGLIQF